MNCPPPCLHSRVHVTDTRRLTIHAPICFLFLVAFQYCFPQPVFGQVTRHTFGFDSEIDLGLLINGKPPGDDQPPPDDWREFLGVKFDTKVAIGGIAGRRNAVVIPEIREPLFNNVIIPEVRADTRSGAKITGKVDGRIGLEFFANFDKGGIADSASFAYAPWLEIPTTISAGDVFSLTTQAGLVPESTFGRSQVRLPSANVGADFIFDLNAGGNIEYGLFPVVPYGNSPFAFDTAAITDDPNGAIQLLEFGIDLNDPDSPFFSMPLFGFEFGLGGDELNDTFTKQISLEPKNKPTQGAGQLFSRDVGEVQLIRPVAEAIDVSTDLDTGNIDYTVQADILRLGLDLDGLASIAASGVSYTRAELTVGDKDSDLNGTLEAQLIDVKYGPELGLRFENSISTDFVVSVGFDKEILIKSGDDVRIGDRFEGRWSELPEIAVLSDDEVEVTVQFDELEAVRNGEQFLTVKDYLEVSALELSASLNLIGLPIPLASLGPAFHQRYSPVSDLLGGGTIDFELGKDSELLGSFPIDSEQLPQDTSFVIKPVESPKLYLNRFSIAYSQSTRCGTVASNRRPHGTDHSHCVHAVYRRR